MIQAIEAESAHDKESLCIEVGLGSFNTVKVLGLKAIWRYT